MFAKRSIQQFCFTVCRLKFNFPTVWVLNLLSEVPNTETTKRHVDQFQISPTLHDKTGIHLCKVCKSFPRQKQWVMRNLIVFFKITYFPIPPSSEAFLDAYIALLNTETLDLSALKEPLTLFSWINYVVNMACVFHYSSQPTQHFVFVFLFVP